MGEVWWLGDKDTFGLLVLSSAAENLYKLLRQIKALTILEKTIIKLFHIMTGINLI